MTYFSVFNQWCSYLGLKIHIKKNGRTSTKNGKTSSPRMAWEYQPTGIRNPGRPRMWWTIEPEQAMGPIP
jgi:hypothetical protein